MRPRSANSEASYKERYLFWAGPFESEEQVRPGQGLLEDFSALGGQSQPQHVPSAKRLSHPGGKN
jgi:hypothetical protein